MPAKKKAKKKAIKKRQVIFLHMDARQRAWLKSASKKLSAIKGRNVSQSKITTEVLGVYQRAGIQVLQSLVLDRDQ